MDLITIGQIIKNQGNKGEVRVFPLTDFPNRFELLDYVFLVKDNKKIKKKVENTWLHKGKFIVIKFSDVNNIGEAIALKDFFVKIPREMMIPLQEDEYYIDDIIGFEVMNINGEKIGDLAEVMTTGGTDIFVVKGAGKDYMIPASREIITKIDQESELIIVDPLPGLLDL